MKGFALLEVLVAVLLISIGCLGVVGMQMLALQHTKDAYYHSLATIQLSSMLDRLRANQSAAARDVELQYWNVLNKQLLPDGKGGFHCVENNCEVNLHWKFKQQYNLNFSGLI